MSLLILNNLFPWDGSDLGSYSERTQWSWTTEGRTYHGVILPQGTLYYCRKRYRNNFPLIVHHLAHLFHLPARGVHTITLDGASYIIYYVPYHHDFLMHEVVLSHLPKWHSLRSDTTFVSLLRQWIVFSDFLALSYTNESSFIIRDNQPILTDDGDTSLTHEQSNYDSTTIPGTLFEKWFGEHASLEDFAHSLLSCATKENDMVLALGALRHEIEHILNIVDRNYIWYANCIVDRCARYILKEKDFSLSQ